MAIGHSSRISKSKTGELVIQCFPRNRSEIIHRFSLGYKEFQMETGTGSQDD
jgi:hypothetical protein